MEWPFGPYETVMGTILLMTIPLQRLLTRDEPEMRVPLSELLAEIRDKGYKWLVQDCHGYAVEAISLIQKI